MSKTFELAELIEMALENGLLDVHVALPARVESYDATTQTVEVVPLMKRIIDDDDGVPTTEDLPKLPPMPVIFPRVRNFLLAFPIVAGDTGQVLFNEVAIGMWLGTTTTPTASEVVSPGDMRRHTLAGGVFIPGLYNARNRSDRARTSAAVGKMVVGAENGVAMTFGQSSSTAAEVKTSLGVAAALVTVPKLVNAISNMLLAGESVPVAATPGPATFAAARLAWDATMGTVPPVPGLADVQLGATKLRAE